MQSYELPHMILTHCFKSLLSFGRDSNLTPERKECDPITLKILFQSGTRICGAYILGNKDYFLHEYLFSLLPAVISFSTSTSDITPQTSITKHRSSNIGHHTSNIQHRSPNNGHQTSVIRHQTTDIKHRSSNIGHQTSLTKHRSFVTKHPTSNISHQTSVTKHRTSNIHQRSPNTKHRSPNIQHFQLHQLHPFRVPKNWFLLCNTQITG